jgi:hypothetical protein
MVPAALVGNLRKPRLVTVRIGSNLCRASANYVHVGFRSLGRRTPKAGFSAQQCDERNTLLGNSTCKYRCYTYRDYGFDAPRPAGRLHH